MVNLAMPSPNVREVAESCFNLIMASSDDNNWRYNCSCVSDNLIKTRCSTFGGSDRSTSDFKRRNIYGLSLFASLCANDAAKDMSS